MATPKINENCHHVQNDPHKCKIKLEKFHFDIMCRFGVIKESLPGRGGGIRPPPSGEIGLKTAYQAIFGLYTRVFELKFWLVAVGPNMSYCYRLIVNNRC